MTDETWWTGWVSLRSTKKKENTNSNMFRAHFNHFPLHTANGLVGYTPSTANPDDGKDAARAKPRNWRHSNCMRQVRASEAIVINFIGAGKVTGKRAARVRCPLVSRQRNSFDQSMRAMHWILYISVQMNVMCDVLNSPIRVVSSRVVSYGKSECTICDGKVKWNNKNEMKERE